MVSSVFNQGFTSLACFAKYVRGLIDSSNVTKASMIILLIARCVRGFQLVRTSTLALLCALPTSSFSCIRVAEAAGLADSSIITFPHRPFSPWASSLDQNRLENHSPTLLSL